MRNDENRRGAMRTDEGRLEPTRGDEGRLGAIFLVLFVLFALPAYASLERREDVSTFKNSSGAVYVLPNATVTVYRAGTLTPATLYSEGTGSVGLANPVTSDSSGRYYYYAEESGYDEKIARTGYTTQYRYAVSLKNHYAAGATYYDARDSATLSAADTAALAAGKTLVCMQTYTITSAVTITSPVRYEKGCNFVKSGGTLDLIGGITGAPDYKIFTDWTSGLTVTTSAPLYPELFGGNYDRQIYGILRQGQSLCVGGKGGNTTGVWNAELPANALMLRGGPTGSDTLTPERAVVALRDGSNANITYGGLGRVTTSSSAARHIMSAARLRQYPNFTAVWAGQCRIGSSYDDLKKGALYGIYEEALSQVEYLMGAMPGYFVQFLEVIHGDADGAADNPTYDLDIAEWRTNIDTDVKALGQIEDVIMFLIQTNSSRSYGHSGGVTETEFPVAWLQYKAHKANPTHIKIASSAYWIPYADGVHPSNAGQRLLGEKLGQAFDVYISTGDWQPLEPDVITLGTSTIVIDYHVPYGEITIDATTIASVANYGFDYFDGSGRTISSVVKTGPAQITITLSGPLGANALLSYAYHNGTGLQTAGLGERGNIRDQDPTISVYADETVPLYNWGITFREALN